MFIDAALASDIPPTPTQALLKVADLKCPPEPRYAHFKKLVDPLSGEAIDHGLVLWFPGESVNATPQNGYSQHQ